MTIFKFIKKLMCIVHKEFVFFTWLVSGELGFWWKRAED